MATTFKDIYSRAIFRFADYDFLKKDIQTREDILQKYLMSSISDFAQICKSDLYDYNLEKKTFNVELSDEEQEILSLGISFYWLSYKTLDSRAMKNVLNGKDYSYYSPAALLKEVQTLRSSIRDEFRKKMVRYSYNDNSFGNLKP